MYADIITKDVIRSIIERRGNTAKEVRPVYESTGKQAGTKYITDTFMKYDLERGEFPITSLRPIPYKRGINEMLVHYQDQSSKISDFEKRGVGWWKQWALDDGTIGERYGKTVANYDIINNLLEELKSNPFGRRHILNLWQYKDLENYAKLPPCAFQVMFDVRPDGDTFLLDASLTQRSSDFLVAGHINQMQYVAFQMMVAKHCGYKVGTFSWHVMNLHIYDNQFEQAKEMLLRKGQKEKIKFYLDVPDGTNFYDIKIEDFIMENYFPVKPQLEKFDLAI